MKSFVSEWQRTARAAATTLSTTDGRWALLSTSMTALVAGSIAWLAVGVSNPAGNSTPTRHERSLMPYQLFMQLAARNGSSQASYASFAPTGDMRGSVAAAQRGPTIPMDGQVVDQSENTLQATTIDSRTVTMEKGDTMVGALAEAGVSQQDASAAVMAMKAVYDPRDVRAGEQFEISFSTTPPHVAHIISITGATLSSIDASDEDSSFDDNSNLEPGDATPIDNLLKITFSPNVEREITITRNPDGSYTAQDVVKKLVAQTHRAGGTIDSSLYAAAVHSGVPTDVVVDMIHVLSYKVDFQRDLRPGDSFEVLYDYYYTEDGHPAKQGNVSFASINLGDRTVTLYRYQPNPDEPADYFDAQGQSVKGMLMKTPVDGARITSGFGMRFHPVLGYSRMHKGIDFGVPIGTPVMAAGSGVVQLEGRMGGYGNFVKVNHGNGYATGYGHLSRFAPGVHIGSRVRQGQVIAYSGNTGISTGPHLHYEIFQGGAQVNPLKVKIAMGQRLVGKDMHKFLDSRIHIDDVLASLPLERKMADNASDLRSAKSQ
ncbi:MAG TPA: M23 family metallopeptidase [Rhizomicrobium sp.]|nr:M23 family metallopeptidase [Rhizomicrobium sp.]